MITLSDFYNVGGSSGGGTGLAWTIETTNKTTASGTGYMMDTTGGIKTVTLHSSPVVGDTVAVADLKGTFDQYGVTISRNGMLIQGASDDLILDVKNQRVVMVYSGATDGWIITELEPNGSQFEYMPYAVMHVQEQKAYNNDGGTTSAGNNIRKLNTVVTNEISGTSLNTTTGEITLPAGEYEIFGHAAQDEDTVGVGLRTEIIDAAGVVLLRGPNIPRYGGVGPVSGRITLASVTVIRLNSYTTQGHATTGLGTKSLGTPEVYADLKITKIGGNYAPKPIISSARYETIPNLITTGHMMGFDMSKTGANQITVTKGTCLDSTLSVALTLTADTVLAIPAVANTIYHVFVVRLVSNGAFTVKAYTSEAAAASDVLINAFRWIGFWITDASTNCLNMKNSGEYYYLNSDTPYVVVSVGSVNVTTLTSVNISSYIPASRVTNISFGCYGGRSDYAYTYFRLSTSTSSPFSEKVSGGYNTTDTYLNPGRYNGEKSTMIPISSGEIHYVRWQHSTYPENGYLYISSLKVRR